SGFPTRLLQGHGRDHPISILRPRPPVTRPSGTVGFFGRHLVASQSRWAEKAERPRREWNPPAFWTHARGSLRLQQLLTTRGRLPQVGTATSSGTGVVRTIVRR